MRAVFAILLIICVAGFLEAQQIVPKPRRRVWASFFNDRDTGLGRVGEDTISFVVGDIEMLVVDKEGLRLLHNGKYRRIVVAEDNTLVLEN